MIHIIVERIPDVFNEGWFHNIEMIYEDNNNSCSLKIELICPDKNILIKRIDDEFKNHSSLSALLDSELTTHEARKFLYRNKVPKESLLWSLNHSGWSDMSKE